MFRVFVVNPMVFQGFSKVAWLGLFADGRRVQEERCSARGNPGKGLGELPATTMPASLAGMPTGGGVEYRCTGSRDLSIVVGRRNDKEVAKVVTNQMSMPGEPTVVGEGDDTAAMGVYCRLGPAGQFDRLEQQRFVFIKSRNLAQGRSVQAPVSGVLPTVREARSKAEGSSRESAEVGRR
ncbi:hypothetical protein NE237_001754 [Protea cynaroides]|uniref:Uncharacterized protein n=1 Tax=Protea cynaroides TaxID=273540 RepID=A0A9Q0QYE1_9MAGN|nr:hypothetical protein NE237_001754 [Protea cynaroides]